MINWQAVVLIAGILPLATALNKSGAAHLLASAMTTHMGSLAPVVMLGFIFIITISETERVPGGESLADVLLT